MFIPTVENDGINGSQSLPSESDNSFKLRKKFRSRMLACFCKHSSKWLSTYSFLLTAGIVLFGCTILVVMKMMGKDAETSIVRIIGWDSRARVLLQRQSFQANADEIHSVRIGAEFVLNLSKGKKWFYTGPPNKKEWRDPSQIYAIPGALPHIGDKSDGYAQLRKDYDEFFPPGHPQRSLETVKRLQINKYEPVSMTTEPLNDGQQMLNADPYDIYNCPETPPPNYPFTWSLVKDIINSWPADDIQPRKRVFQSLCVFDYNRDYGKALNYRKAELPFVVVNDPEVAEAVERWNTPGFLETMMGNVMHRCEISKNNHFLYWVQPPRRQMRGGKLSVYETYLNWTEPTELTRMKYKDWLKHANVSFEGAGIDKPHWYYRLIGCGEMGDCDEGSSEYLFDEFTFFQPRPYQLYLDEYRKQKGIHCRFGMKGVIAENHYDVGRNSIALIGGERRYILAHPNQCEYLGLYPNTHPSARHSAVDWSDPDLAQYPAFAQARANEVVMQAGDVMYLPTNWFHYIISMQMNYQCNTRSGISYHYHKDLRKCGFMG